MFTYTHRAAPEREIGFATSRSTHISPNSLVSEDRDSSGKYRHWNALLPQHGEALSLGVVEVWLGEQ